ncbi:hypothetical protein F444_08943 [Phytophthora nicotianae P1976]|uniref:Uncharacterized protein n=1 Tax=Phytophthora nicotianae P1976 TaxID=1317066 RepID=A0A081A9C6_PHYNI|nr:hypothetical protein F444_08943 [Phytophthora nicotianae P1976]
MQPKASSSPGVDKACVLLTVVGFVVRERLQLHGIDLPHVWRGIDDYLSELPRGWPLAEAYIRTGSLRCMQYVAFRESKEAGYPSYRMWMVDNVAALAMDRGDVKALEWLAQRYSPDTPARVEDW